MSTRGGRRRRQQVETVKVGGVDFIVPRFVKLPFHGTRQEVRVKDWIGHVATTLKSRAPGSFLSSTVRHLFSGMEEIHHHDKDYQKRLKFVSRCQKSKANGTFRQFLDDKPPVKRLRMKGSGRKSLLVDIRQDLFDWFVDCRVAFKARIPRSIFLVKARQLYDIYKKQAENNHQVPRPLVRNDPIYFLCTDAYNVMRRNLVPDGF